MRPEVSIVIVATHSEAWAEFETLAAGQVVESYRLASAIVGPDDAADAVQDALVEAWRHLGDLRDPNAFHAWLRSIVINRCRNMLRARSRRVRTIALDLAPARLVDPRAEPTLRLEQRDRLDRAFEQLSIDHRAVLALRFTLDLPVREIAQTLRVPEGTVKSRLNAAVTRLRVALQEDPHD